MIHTNEDNGAQSHSSCFRLLSTQKVTRETSGRSLHYLEALLGLPDSSPSNFDLAKVGGLRGTQMVFDHLTSHSFLMTCLRGVLFIPILQVRSATFSK